MPPDSNCVHHVYYCRLSLVCLVVNLVGNTFTISVCVFLAAHLCYGAVAAEPGPRGMY
jgi:hypothetical protein